MKWKSIAWTSVALFAFVGAIAVSQEQESVPSIVRGERAKPEVVARDRKKVEAELGDVLWREWGNLEGKKVSVEGVCWGILEGKESSLKEIQYFQGYISVYLDDEKLRREWKDGRLVRAVGVVMFRKPPVWKGPPGLHPQMVFNYSLGLQVEELRFIEKTTDPGIRVIPQSDE